MSGDRWWEHFCEPLGVSLSVIEGEECSWCGKEKVLTLAEFEKKEGDELIQIMKNLEQGRKYDGGKPQLYLLPPKSINEVGKVLTFGAEKYDPHNWRKVDDLQNRYSSAALRHIFAHIDGEDADEETGLSHLAHAICCLMFKLEDELLGKSEEERL